MEQPPIAIDECHDECKEFDGEFYLGKSGFQTNTLDPSSRTKNGQKSGRWY